MNSFIIGVPLLAAAATSILPAPATDVGMPPPRDALPEIAPPAAQRAWLEGAVDGAFLEAPLTVTPVRIVPDTGIRPPSAHEDEGVEEVPRQVRPAEWPLFVPRGGDEAPIVEDRAAGRAQPLMQDWESIGPNGLTPPDPDAAAGWDYVVTVTNDDFAVYDRCGNVLYTADIEDYLGTDPAYLLYDPKVIFDPWNGRWVMLWHKKRTATEESSLALVITSGSIPFGLSGSGAYWYDFNAVQDAGTADASWADYFDLGYSNEHVFAGGNMFRFAGGFRWARIWIWDKAQIYNALAAGVVRWSNLTNADGSTTDTPRAVKMQTGWTEGGLNIDGTWINSRWGGGDRLTHWKVTDAFGANTLTRVDIPVAAYTVPPSAVQPTGELLDTIDARLMTAVTTNDNLGANGIELFTSLTTEFSGTAWLRLFKLDPTSNTLEYQTTFGSTGWYYWFGSSAADYSGSNFWVFTRTTNSAGGEPEVRFVDYDQGVFSSSGSSSIRDGSGSYDGWRWGDYFGGQLDWGDYSANYSTPGRPAKVWLYGEFGKSDSWGTHVGATSVWSQGVLSSVTPSSTYVISGPEGGPFSPGSRIYTLTNSGQVGLAFDVTGLPSWLSTSAATGQAFPGTTNVTLSVNSAANSLDPGVYYATVTFRDCFNGGLSYNRSVELTVETAAVATFRNDAGNTNPTGYVAAPPIMGAMWNASVNNGLTGNNVAGVAGYSTPLSLYMGGIGDWLLVNVGDPNGELLGLPGIFGVGIVNFSALVPVDPAFIGFHFSTQGYGFGGGAGVRLHNAYDLVVGNY
ncbi:MAG: hypothetical protein AB1726_01910 [Planctomycetota bacterium]